MFSLKQQKLPRRRKTGRLSSPEFLSPDEIASAILKKARTFTMPDIGLALFAHAKENTPLSCNGAKITQYRVVEERPSFNDVLSNDVWVTVVEDLVFLADKKVIIKGPKLTEFDIKAFLRIFPELRKLFVTGKLEISLADLIRIAANYQCRDYFRALVSVVCLMQVTFKIEASKEKNEAYLRNEKPLLTLFSKEIREALAKLLGSEDFIGKNGVQLIKASNLLTVNLQGSALEAFFVVGTPTILPTSMGAEKRHICNLTQVIHPDCKLAKKLGLASVRVLAVFFAFSPYFVSIRNEIQNGADVNPERSKTYPYKSLSLEAIAAISGRLNMFRNHFGLFVERVLKPIAKFVGELVCEGKTNLHILFDRTLTQMGSKAYAKVKAKFEGFKERLYGERVSPPKSLPEAARDQSRTSEPENMKEMQGRLKSFAAQVSSERAKKEIEILRSLSDLGINFAIVKKSYRNFVERFALAP